MSNSVENILAPFNYVFAQKGKNIRSKFANAISDWFDVKPELVETFSLAWDKLHNASLIIDDIEDNSELRRGKPAAHLIYGVPLSINAANYVYFEVLAKLLELNRIELVKIFTEQMLALHHGQGMDLYWRDQFDFLDLENPGNDGIQWDATDLSKFVPLEKDYVDVIVKKTSGQFVLCLKATQVFSPNKDFKDVDVTKLAELVGLCFQVRDDLMNLTSSEYSNAKGFCEDISEGKLSLPVIHALNKKSFPEEKRQRLWAILRMKTTDPRIKEEALDILEESGAIQYTEELLVKIKLDIKKEIEKLGGNEKLDRMLKDFWG